jgi:hypothetical protein
MDESTTATGITLEEGLITAGAAEAEAITEGEKEVTEEKAIKAAIKQAKADAAAVKKTAKVQAKLDRAAAKLVKADAKAAQAALDDLESDDSDELSSKDKKKLINVENLTRKFKSQVQGNQKKISTWEDRTVAKLKQMGFISIGFGADGKWRLRMAQTPQGQMLELPITACISSNHGPRSSTGFLKFTDDAVPAATVVSAA